MERKEGKEGKGRERKHREREEEKGTVREGEEEGNRGRRKEVARSDASMGFR